MSANVIFNPTHKTLSVTNFFVTRQPILDRHQNLVAHEILICSTPLDTPDLITDFPEIALVLAHFSDLDIEKIMGDSHGFINVNGDILMSNVIDLLPPEKVTLQIASDAEPTPALLERMAGLTAAGFRLSLRIVSSEAGKNVQDFFPLVDVIRLDVHDLALQESQSIIAQCKLAGKKVLADKVETSDQFQLCCEHGSDYVLGYFFAVPVIVTGKKLSPSQIAVMQLMGLITTDADSAEIELGLKRDVTLGLNLLRLVNTPSVGSHRIDSLKQALMVLGRNQLQRWLQIMLYAEQARNGQNLKPLLLLAACRGKLLELMAHKHKAGNSSVADTAFMVGIMSLMDTLFGLPMEDVLKETAVVDEVFDALLSRKGYYGELLKFAENSERFENMQTLAASLKALQLTSEEFYLMQLQAFEWSDSISQIIH